MLSVRCASRWSYPNHCRSPSSNMVMEWMWRPSSNFPTSYVHYRRFYVCSTYLCTLSCIQYTVAYTGIPPSTTTATRLLASSFRMILHSELPAFFLHWHRVTSYRNLISVYTRILLSLGFHFDSITWLSSGLRSTCASLKCYSRRSTSLLFSFSRVRFLASMMSSR